MPCDLDDLFAASAALVPDAEGAVLVISEETLERPPSSLKSDRLVIQKTYHQYDDFCRRDLLNVHATKATYRQLGLLAASVLFSSNEVAVSLRLDHPESDIKTLIIQREAILQTELPGFHRRPHVLNYYAAPVSKHPWAAESVEPRDLPAFLLASRDPGLDWERRDTVLGFGSDAGCARFVELLLDAGRPSSPVDEFELEGEGGFRGVAPFSCEVRLWLPGSVGWTCLLPP